MIILIWVLILACIPAAIGKSKGDSFFVWWLYGVLLFPIALIHACTKNKDVKRIEQNKIKTDGLKKCPMCAELVKMEAVKCKHCSYEFVTQITDSTLTVTNVSPVESSNDDPTKCNACLKTLAKGEWGFCYPCSRS